ncbi:methylated-DNA--[protein]-cysteine S-methyltransferase [Clostridium sp. JN-9]|uniref:methylated-DNA--[protein]-cysteine S-methyltransferase n=1 Tax=Clostridium sp. JN-9 TaxID=2507159 RepID=UPI000FFDFF94|nr:methylated-DNA--[protein]-cysteine S-methyltransferase [Clostridium sp. JN-9]QAT39228.1 methylated-DNA--[protein]-cysteine S-methyltransferase [Clostridium sp. JN-9]
MKSLYFYNTDIGKIGIADNGKAITNVYFNESPKLKDTEIKETDLIKEAAQQLKEYLAGKRKSFNIPLMPEGTEFQKSVWEALQQIPYGKTCSYGEIAEKIGNPKACRAVGMANNKNPIGIFIPCHRVIGANGKLVGYAGGLEMKEHLLAIEKINADK